MSVVEALEHILRTAMNCENPKLLSKLLLRAASKGRISCDEALSLAPIEEVREALLDAYAWRMLVPHSPGSPSTSLSWFSRSMLLGVGEIYEMPNVVAILIKNTVRMGGWNPCKAVHQYFRDIGERMPERYVELYRLLVKDERRLMVTPEEIVRHASKLGINPSAAIAKLKGAGIISPIVDGRRILYEVNPSLTINRECK
ncbi:MAG TPA: hypothetical protein ENF42_01265 [Candidatus Bathyarchaeota archaeon]|nr:hypothetical protein [Candidatus Bathyarchaeota archaeon]